MLLCCQAGCSTEAICRELGIPVSALFDPEPPDAQHTNGNGKSRVTATYPYTDAGGNLLFEVLRFEPKTFRQRRPDGKGGWIPSIGGVARVLFRLPQVLAAVAAGTTIWIVEGEKDVEALERSGEVATTNAGGAGKWRSDYADVLAGAAEVIIVQDKDPAGQKHAADVEASLVGRVGRVIRVEALTGKDAADHLGAERSVDDFVPLSDSQAPPPDAALRELIEREIPDVGDGIGPMAAKVAEQVKVEHVRGIAQRLVRDQRLTRDANLGGIVLGTAADMLARPRQPHQSLLGDLVFAGHNVTVTARYKVGKSTLAENMVRALTSGGLFLARFPVPEPLRVCYLNYELGEDDMADRIARMRLTPEEQERMLILNLRGHRLPLMTTLGRDWMVKRLSDHRADVMVVDPFGAAFAAAGGENENDNAEVRRFLVALDEIKRLAACPSLILPMHTGRAEQIEGDEHSRGATVVDDWADVRVLMTRDKDDQTRYLRTEGRAMDLPESRLGFQDGRLMLAGSDVGLTRSRARHHEQVDTVVTVLRRHPGISLRQLREKLSEEGVRGSEIKDSTVAIAIEGRVVHQHPGPRRALLHYVGPGHGADPCPEGWEPQGD